MATFNPDASETVDRKIPIAKRAKKNSVPKWAVALAVFGVVVFASMMWVGLFWIADPMSGYDRVTDEDIRILRKGQDGLLGKTLVWSGRFAGIEKEFASGYVIKLELEGLGNTTRCWLPREADFPELQFGDLVNAALVLKPSGFEAVKIRRR